VTDAALRILSENREKPLYLWMHYYDAHPPYGDPPGVKAPHADDTVFYDEELAYIDKQLGRLIDAVDRRSDPTYLVFTSDHATSFYPVEGVRRWNYGYDIYTSTLHVPLIVHGPGIPAGRVDHVVSTMDVAPTLVNLLGLQHTEKFEGTSLVPELLAGATDAHRVVFHEYYLPENEFRGHGDPLEFVSVRTDRYDLILNREHGSYELYDWSADYWEEHDLYAELAGTPEIARIRSLLAAFLLRYTGNAAAKAPPATPPRIGIGRGRFPAVDR
jgi:arylsulfatase A-like enzyme